MISKNKFLRYAWGGLLLLIGVFVIASRWKISFTDLGQLAQSLKPGYLLFLLGFQALTYFGDSWLTKIILEIAGFKIKFRDTLRVAILDVVGSHLVPFIGPSAVTYYFYRKFNIPSPSLIFLVVAWTAFIVLVYTIFFITSLFLLPSSLPYLFSGTNTFFLLGGAVILLTAGIWLVKNKWSSVEKLLIKLIGLISNDGKSLENFGSKFKETAIIFWRSKPMLVKALAAAFLFYLGDILTLYFAFLAFGFKLSLPIIIAGLTISSILPLFTLIPEAPGVAETALVISFVSLGVSSHAALLASLLFRIFSYWIPLPLGVISFFQIRRQQFT